VSYAIPFTRVHLTGRELEYIRQAVEASHLAGDGPFTKRCERLLEQLTGCTRALLTHSCTGALEMAAILAEVGPGDEVIMPSFTFVSTANAFVLRGATPVFVDVEPETFTLDVERTAAAVTPRTRAIVPVHYAGIACDLDAIAEIARRANAIVIEDAAQSLLSTHAGRPLGSIGRMATLSFHETKNVTSGEGGALLINDPDLLDRAEVIREKGTDRSRFFRGQVDKYTWTDIGSSYLPPEIVAAFLLAQLEHAQEITEMRASVWRAYHAALKPLESAGALQRSADVFAKGGNAHLYAIMLPSLAQRTRVIDVLRTRSIYAAFHYVPLHSSPAGKRFGRTAGELPVTDDIADRLLRLPLWPDMTPSQIALVVDAVAAALR
jgi:dTDP-4-amino-4,6-dideoxygalactose transaminase